MGSDVGWHLRFTRARVVEVLASKAGAAQIRHHLGPDMGWTMTVAENPDGSRLVRLERD